MRFVRALAAAALLGGLAIPGLARPAAVSGVGPLPDCRLDDVLTEPRGYDDWATTLVDWNLTLGPRYRPPDLVSVREGGVAGGGYVRALVIDDLKAMSAAAKKNGTPLVALSPFRGYKQQVALFNGYAGWNGKRYTNFDSAITFSARPGHSEHQTGLTIDFVAVGDTGLTSNWEVTRTGGWMAKNAWKYGWLMSYPKGKDDLVCYHYEPWHYRYVGRELARTIHDSGLTIREYLWANFTQLDATCVALPEPTIEPAEQPSTRSCALAEPSPTNAATPSSPPATAPTAAASLPPPASGAAATAPPPTEPAGVFGVSAPIAIGLVAAVGVGVLVSLGLRRRARR